MYCSKLRVGDCRSKGEIKTLDKNWLQNKEIACR